MHSKELVEKLEEIARQMRITLLEMIHRRQAGHPGGSLSAADIVTALYFHHMNIDPKNPAWEERDRFILSKGHASALLYAVLANRGYFPVEDLKCWGDIGCHLQGHPDRIKTPGVDMTSGVLGQGISIGAGLCLAANLNNKKYRTYVVIGCGESESGNIWEGAMISAHYKLSNITVIADYNRVQLDGKMNEIMEMEPYAKKWEAFGFNVIQIDGHNMKEILDALDKAAQYSKGPTVIIAKTVKGKGVSFMENDSRWHGVAPNDEQFRKAIEELKK